MKIERQTLSLTERESTVHDLINLRGLRVGVISSIDGGQLITLLLDPHTGQPHLFETALDSASYPSLTRRISACHWQERILWNMFGLVPEGHPRLKQVLLHEQYDPSLYPLRADDIPFTCAPRPCNGRYQFLEVEGEGVYEIPVGPIHAGIIEPGHFRFSCVGELIFNLEIRLGYVHRGIEKRLTEIDWRKGRFVSEAAASDSAAAYALAFSECIESMFSIELPLRAKQLRVLAVETERIGMHLADLAGLAGDIGLIGMSSSFQRVRGISFAMAELLSGQRFIRGFICPGGVIRDLKSESLKQLSICADKLAEQSKIIVEMLFGNEGVDDRMRGIGRVSTSLAKDFGLLGIAGRACGIKYDARQFHQSYAGFTPVVQSDGDVLARARLRGLELKASLDLIKATLAQLDESGKCSIALPENLPANGVGFSCVEAHRGELIHLAFTDDTGRIKRYAIKDPSLNNWTALAIAVRNNLVADFPLCNKSFSLSYSGHDL